MVVRFREWVTWLLISEALVLTLLQSAACAQNVSLRSTVVVEWLALLQLRSSLQIRDRDWPGRLRPCGSWVGVDCRAGRVVGIDLSGLRRSMSSQSQPRFAVDSLANLTSLAYLNASGFALPGNIPDWFGVRLNALQVLDLRSSSVSGPIPPSLGNLNNLVSLHLSDNSLAGALPTTLGELSSVSTIDLARNLLTGSVPATLSSLPHLITLDLSSNYLSGSIPPELGSLPRLRSLNLGNNSFTAAIPSELGDLTQLLSLELGKNSLSGSLPVELRRLTSLRTLVVSDNMLEGPLPDVLSMMHALQLFDVSNNKLTGVLPDLTSSVGAIGAVFNFSGNTFYGGLRSSSPGRLGTVDVSGNYLPVEVENEANVIFTNNCLRRVPRQKSLAKCEVFYAERNISYNNFGRIDYHLSASPVTTPHHRLKGWVLMLEGLLGGLASFAILVFMLVFGVRKCSRYAATRRRSLNVGPFPHEFGTLPRPDLCSKQLGTVGKFTYEQMLLSTHNFSKANLIKHGHSGDIFQGFLRDGVPIVVKRVDLCTFKNASSIPELDLFNKFPHPRLIPLLGHCLENENEMLLVYRFMPNGDLSNSLYRPSRLKDNDLVSLDWIKRLKIAIGAAEGLSYLHHECTPPIVHRDVQASSILLDDKFEVRLGSLSEACAEEGDPQLFSDAKVLPIPLNTERASPASFSATCAFDVYCFGKILLQLVTGKLGISKSDDFATKEWLEQTLPHINIYDKELVMKIVDPSLIVDEGLLEEVWAMAIVARACLHPRPSKRPLMRHVFKALESPVKVIRDVNASTAVFRTLSSKRSWGAAAFCGNWQNSSSESVSGGFKKWGRLNSNESCANEFSSSNRRLSSENYPDK